MKFPLNVWILGLTSLLNDCSSDMVAPILPLYVTTVLGGSAAALGWIDGCANLTAALLKLWSGKLADRGVPEKPMILSGYGLSSLVRPMLAFATGPLGVLGVRVMDRVGKGIRSSPRDAALAQAVPAAQQGAVFGFHRGMDHAGAALGALGAWAGLVLFALPLPTLILVAALPGMLSLVALAFLRPPPPRSPPSRTEEAVVLPRSFWWAMLAMGLAGLGASTDSFLLLAATGSNLSTSSLPLLWLVLHLIKSASAIWSGPVADRLGRRGMVAAGWIVHILVFTGFAFLNQPWAVISLFLIHGLRAGLSEGAEKAVVSELVQQGRGTAFGWYNLITGAIALPAGVLSGWLWDHVSPAACFGSGAVLTLIGLLVLGRR